MNKSFCLLVIVLLFVSGSLYAMKSVPALMAACSTESQWYVAMKERCRQMGTLLTPDECYTHIFDTNVLNNQAECDICNFLYRADLQTMCAMYRVAAAARLMELKWPQCIQRTESVQKARSTPVVVYDLRQKHAHRRMRCKSTIKAPTEGAWFNKGVRSQSSLVVHDLR